ncbi:hypothetical protein ONE63_003648 [Megalurothrips usitatus]|uniref:Chaoptin n=1 Tax=Megalurothrips usitatus TaxID=439358 RepID=A0AAV7X7J1_9NEOP|nr:hypothetical protein ONE63_003648 [Megalurothrips usitatus]
MQKKCVLQGQARWVRVWPVALLLLALGALPGCLGRSRLSTVDRTTQYPPCYFNPLCSCSKSVPDLGIVWCRDVPLPRAPPPLNASKVYMLHLDNNGLRSLDAHFLTGTGLYRLELSRNPLVHVADEALLGLERSLSELELRWNRLTAVPSRALRHLQKLHLLDLTGNDISDVSHENWRGLERSLTTLVLARNAIESFPSPGTFSSLQALESLDLSGNAIAEVHGDALFSGPHRLQHLYLADNELQWLPYQQLAHLRQLRTLDVSSNRLFSLEAQPGVSAHESRLRLVLHELHLEYNRLEYLPPAAFHQFEMINRTYLDGNPLFEIQEKAFREAHIRELWIRDCRLTYIHPDAMAGLEGYLQVLHLQANNLTQLPAQILARLDQLRELNVRDNQLPDLDADVLFQAFRDRVQRVDVGGRKNGAVGLQEFRNMRSLRALSVSRLPNSALGMDDFEDFAPELDELKVSDGGLQTVKSHAFRHVRGLRFLDLSDSNIGTIEADAFQEVSHSLLELRVARGLSSSVRQVPGDALRHLSILTLLDLSHNRLRTATPATFRQLRQLRVLRLRDNQLDGLASGVLDSEAHAQLEEVDLSFNEIHTLHEHSVYDLPRLERLDLSDNRIGRVDKHAVANLDKLRRLDLRGNRLQHIDPEAFQNLPALEELDLAYNSMSELDFGVLDQVGTLSSFRLNLSHNHIHHLEMHLGGGRDALSHSNVKMLDLSHNNVSTIARYYFRPVESSLTHLFMSWNSLRNATRDVFGNMPHLTWLDLSVNELLEIDFDTFRNSRNLQVLYLARNYLSDLPGELFRALSQLRLVDVSHNRLRSLPDNLWSEPCTERVDLSDNQLSRLPVNSFSPAAAATLVEWDLSHNYLVALHAPEMLGRFRSLQLLDLSNNRLTQLEDAPFSALPRLAILDLSHNPELRLEARSRTFQSMQESLLDLRLSNISLHQVPELPLPALQALRLSHNLLVQLPPEMATSLTGLRRLDLSFNGLPQVPLVATQLPQLRRLNLAGNPITVLSNTSLLGGAERLRELDLRRLPLQHFETGALSKITALQSLAVATYKNVADFNIPMRLQENHGLRNLLVEVDDDGEDLDGEMRGPLPDKLQNVTLTGLHLRTLPVDVFMGVRSPRFMFTLRNTSVDSIPRSIWDQMQYVRNLTLDLRNNSLKHLANPNMAARPDQRGMFLTGLQMAGNRWSCDCDLGWLEVWERKKRQYWCPRPTRPLGPLSAQESREFLYWETNVDCREQHEDDLREAHCGRGGGHSVLEAMKADVECGWGAGAHLGPSVRLVLVAVAFWTLFARALHPAAA